MCLITYSALMLDTVTPEVTGRKLPPKHVCAAHQKHWPYCNHTTRRMVDWESVVENVTRSHSAEARYTTSNVKESMGGNLVLTAAGI